MEYELSSDQGPWLDTHSGHRFYYLEPAEQDIALIDIAINLSRIVRFNGCLNRSYTVGMHSLYVEEAARFNGHSPEERLQVLLHDAAEAYIGDIVAPLKSLFPRIKEMERNILRVIGSKFGVQLDPLPDWVGLIDKRATLAEAEVFGMDTTGWLKEVEGIDSSILRVNMKQEILIQKLSLTQNQSIQIDFYNKVRKLQEMINGDTRE